ncbi:hypothetical protein ROU88_08110 [Macrococcus capreoli]
MTNQLLEVEQHYQLLCKTIMDSFSVKKPHLLIEIEEYISELDKLSVLERIYLLSELLEAIAKDQKTIEELFDESSFNDLTLNTLKYWAHFT